MSTTSVNVLARWRATEKRKREARLAAAHARVGSHRQTHPLPQGQLELDDEYVSKREHDLKVLRKIQLDQERHREALRLADESSPPLASRIPRWLELELLAAEA